MENEGIICNSINIHYMDNLQKKKAPLIEYNVLNKY